MQPSAKTPSAFGRGLSSGSCFSIRQASRGTACGYLAGIRTPFCTVPTDEELMIAQHTLSLLLNRDSASSPKRERAS